MYGGSFVVFLMITVATFWLLGALHVKIEAAKLSADWTAQRCHPSIIPFAGIIQKRPGQSWSEATGENFTYCIQNVLKSITGDAVEPLAYSTSILSETMDAVGADIQNVRAMFDKIRSSFQQISEEIMGRAINVAIPLQTIVISFKDVLSKIQGVLTASLFTSLGTYYTLKSLLGAIAQFIIIILIALACLIVICWLFVFSFPAAIANTAVFAAIAIPMACILAFMVDVLHVKTNLAIPSVKCFDPSTPLICLDNGLEYEVLLSEIRPGIVLDEGIGKVTSVICVETAGSTMYDLGGLKVSDSHLVKNKSSQWIHVRDHPDAIRLDSFESPILLCLNTESKILRFPCSPHLFSDWDEVEGGGGQQQPSIPDYGFAGSTRIHLENGDTMAIKDIVPGTRLQGGIRVYGNVILDGYRCPQFWFWLDEPGTLIQGTQLVFPVSKKVITSVVHFPREPFLYHILTDQRVVPIDGIMFHDYNWAVDRFNHITP